MFSLRGLLLQDKGLSTVFFGKYPCSSGYILIFTILQAFANALNVVYGAAAGVSSGVAKKSLLNVFNAFNGGGSALQQVRRWLRGHARRFPVGGQFRRGRRERIGYGSRLGGLARLVQ